MMMYIQYNNYLVFKLVIGELSCFIYTYWNLKEMLTFFKQLFDQKLCLINGFAFGIGLYLYIRNVDNQRGTVSAFSQEHLTVKKNIHLFPLLIIEMQQVMLITRDICPDLCDENMKTVLRHYIIV